MDNYLFDKIYEEDVPHFNPVIAEGYATKEVADSEFFVDHLLKCAQESFPEGMVYEGYKPCTPKSQYAAMTKRRHGKQEFEFARSDVRMYEYHFTLNNKKLETQRMLLPFVGEAGEINIRGSKFFVFSVLADKSFSVGINSLFLPVNRDKLTFERVSHTYLIDGQPETDYVYWSAIHHSLKDKVPAGEAVVPNELKTPLYLYLFSKYGLTGTFRRVFDCEVEYNHIDELDKLGDGWIVCQSNGVRPVGVKNKFYRSSDIGIAIKTTHITKLMSTLLASFFYILDYFPDRIRLDELEDTRLWKILLGQIIFKNKSNLGKLVDGVDVHLDSLSGYMDDMTRENLDKEGIHVETIYDLFIYVITNFSFILSTSDVSTLYGKKLTVLRYLLFDITKAISRLVFKLQKLTPKKITERDINSTLARSLKHEIIYGIVGPKHGEVTGVSYPGDSKILKITSTVVLQADATGSRAKGASLSDPSRFLNASVIEHASVTNQPKSEPTGKNKLSMFTKVDPDGVLIPTDDPDDREMLDGIQSMISRN